MSSRRLSSPLSWLRVRGYLALLSFLVASHISTATSSTLFTSRANSQVQGTLHRRNYFYVGEEFVPASSQPGGNSSSTIAAGQIYVEHLVPANVTRALPLLMIHGHGMTGTNFLNTPDGRLGWADYFMSQGFELYIIDQPSRGRSAWQIDVDGNQSSYDTFTASSHFTAPEKFNLWPQAALHTQWPGSGLAGDPIFDNFFASTMPSLVSDEESSVKIKSAVSTLLDDIGVSENYLFLVGETCPRDQSTHDLSLRSFLRSLELRIQPVILLTHSQSGQYSWILGDSRPALIKTIIALEPIGPPFINTVFPPFTAARPFGVTEIPIAFNPPITNSSEIQREPVPSESSALSPCFKQKEPARQMVNLVGIPTLVVTSESSYHAVYDNCTVGFLKQAGVPVEHVALADVGIRGNAHMMFMEKNGLEIAEKVVLNWIEKTVPPE